MAIFALYHYSLSKFGNKQLTIKFASESEIVYDSFEDLFESFLTSKGSSLDLYDEKTVGRGKNKSTEIIRYKSEVLQHSNHIVAFRLQVNKTKTVSTEDWEQDKVGDFPEYHVLIDNRPDRHLIAIQKSSITDTDKIFNLLKLNFNRKLKQYSVKFECILLIKHMNFWDSVYEIKNKLNDAVRRIQFDFVGKKTPGKTYTDEMLRFIYELQAKAKFFIEVKNDEALSRVTNDLTRMADLCRENNDYALTVQFRDFGLFRYGQDVKAQYGLSDDIFMDYIAPVKELSLFEKDEAKKKIQSWFDNIIDLFSDYIYDIKDDKSPINIGFYVLRQEYKEDILDKLRIHISRYSKPKQVILPLRAAIDAGCIDKPSKEIFEKEYGLSISNTTWKRYIGGTIHPYLNNPVFKIIKEEFTKIIS